MYKSAAPAAVRAAMGRFMLTLLVSWVFAPTSLASFIVFEAAGSDAAAVTPTRDAFRVEIGGGTVAGANGSFGGVRREINWDGVPDARSDPNLLPGNFFNVNSPRGLECSTSGTGFLVSANAGLATPILFGFPNDLQTFSQQKLFTAVNGTTTDCSFFEPGTNVESTTTAFGLFFVDVEVASLTELMFFDANDVLIFDRFVMVGGNQGLSFLGAVADAGETISRVRIIAGSNTLASNGVLGNLTGDFVAMDDFIFAEPTATATVPESGSLALLGIGLAAVGGARRRARTSRNAIGTH